MKTKDELGAVLAAHAQRSDEMSALIKKRGINISAPPGIQELINDKQLELVKLENWTRTHVAEVLLPALKERDLATKDAKVAAGVLQQDLRNAEAKIEIAEAAELKAWQILKQAQNVAGGEIPLRSDRPQKSFRGQIKTISGVRT